jgi:hypothetical protein
MVASNDTKFLPAEVRNHRLQVLETGWKRGIRPGVLVVVNDEVDELNMKPPYPVKFVGMVEWNIASRRLSEWKPIVVRWIAPTTDGIKYSTKHEVGELSVVMPHEVHHGT